MGAFGIPIDDKKLSRRERAQKALDTLDYKMADAMTWLKHQKHLYGDGVSTLCMIYNATGNDLELVGRHDWYGHEFDGLMKNPPSQYQKVLKNGEIGFFLHVHKKANATGSIGAVVYRGLINGTQDNYCDFMLAWYNPWSLTANRAAYTEIREMDHYNKDAVWGAISNKMQNSKLNMSDQNYGCRSMVGIGNVYSPFFEAILTLEDVY